jgi:flagellin-like hook-associated protein FlgL
MPIVVNNNTSATVASFNLSQANDALRKSLSRLSSGNRIVDSSDDAGGLAVAYKLGSKLKRTEAVRQNIQSGISYLQVQDGAMQVVAKIVDRMSELRTMASDVTKNTQDVENYSKEFIELQSQLSQTFQEKFNGISLFAVSRTPVPSTPPEVRPPLSKNASAVDELGNTYQKFSREIVTTADGVRAEGHVSLNIINMQYVLSLGGIDTTYLTTTTAAAIETARSTTGASDAEGQNIFFNLGNLNAGNLDDLSADATAKTEVFTDEGFLKSILFVSMGQFTTIIEKIADSRAENGAEQSRLRMADELLIQNQTNLEAAYGRIMDADIALESTRFARQNVLVQSSAAMVAQANQLTNIALTILG